MHERHCYKQNSHLLTSWKCVQHFELVQSLMESLQTRINITVSALTCVTMGIFYGFD